MNMTDAAALVFVFWPKISVLEVLCQKAHCYDMKSICPAEDLIFFLMNVLLKMFHNLKAE
jgi:hypothetical protein